MLGKRGSSAMGMAVTLVLVATALIVGVWIFTSVQSSVTLPTSSITESVTFTNLTYVSVANPYINSISSIGNSTMTIGSGNYTYTQSAINMTARAAGATTAIDLTLPYNVAFTYNPSAANDTLGNVVSTTWSSFQLGVVVLIVIAAVAIVGILVAGFGGAAA